MSENNIRPTKKDTILFRYLFENFFLTREQIRKYIYNSRSYANKRMSHLIKAGYLKKQPNPFSRGSYIMSDSKALIYLKSNIGMERLKEVQRNNNFKHYYIKPVNYKVKNRVDSAKFEHDKILNELRFILENIGANYWITDKIVYRKKLHSITADGIFHSKSNKKFALEFENNLKKRSRYKSIFSTYSGERKIDKVLYVVSYDSLFKSIMKKLNPSFISYSNDAYKKFYVANLDDILEGDYRFYNSTSGESFDLKEELVK